jgi:hypothetical protein
VLKLAGALLGFVACLIAIVILIILIWPPPSVAMVLVGADYAENLTVAPNILGWKGLEGLASMAGTRPPWSLLRAPRLNLIRAPRLIDQPEHWDAVIDDLAKAGFREKTIILVAALHGGSDRSGGYLMPGRIRGLQDRIDLSHVIDSMDRLPAEKAKILVLEPSQAPSNARLGILHNDFTRRLRDLEPKIRQIRNLWVLCAADVDQRCWGSEGLGRTIFSHFLIEGLRGNAGGSDGQLTLERLHRYVLERVRNWVWAARGAIQEPILLPGPAPESRSDSVEEASGGETAAGKTASRKPSSVRLAMVENAPESQAPAPPDLETLRKLRRTAVRLDAMVPHPTAYSPRRYREYLAALTRYEALVLSGGEAQAGPVRERIDILARALESERILNLPKSSENTLAMHVVTGSKPVDERELPEAYLKFWNAPQGLDAARIWESMKTQQNATAEPQVSLRMRVDRYLLKRAEDDPVKFLERASERVAITATGSGLLQPAEAHFLKMVASWPDPLPGRSPRVWGLVSQAFAIRSMAEDAAVGAAGPAGDYAYSEQVAPWISTEIARGDRQRRPGEDLLFSSRPDAWDTAEKAFVEAGHQYQEARRRAGIIRAALAVRDRSAAILPEYARWLPHRYADELQTDLVATMEQLCKSSHSLSDQLETPRPDADLSGIDQLSKSLSEKLRHLTQAFTEELARIENARSNEDWEAATAALAVPFADSSELPVRSRLWERLANIRDHDRDPALSHSGQDPLQKNDRVEQSRHVRRRAEIEGLMNLAVLGPRWFNDPRSEEEKGQGDFDATLARVRRADEKADETGETWHHEMAAAGDLVGQRWRQMPVEIARLTSEEEGISQFAEFEQRLVVADGLARQIDGAAPPVEEPAIEGTRRLRQVRVHRLLLAMAERARLDHWYGEKPRETPYFRVAGTAFLDDAAQLVPKSPLLAGPKARLEEKGQVVLSGAPRRTMTSERSMNLSFQVQTEGNVPEGFPVVRPVADRLIDLASDPGGFRAIDRSGASVPIVFPVSSPLIRDAETNQGLDRPVVETTTLKVEGSFRGQPLAFATEIQLHPLPDVVAIGPPPPDPPDASLAVQSSEDLIKRFGKGTGTIAIVLDCSGSMVDPDPNKFKEAKQALIQVLSEVPDGTQVSLWTFSQIPEGVALVPDDKGLLAPANNDPIALAAEKEPETTIKQLLPPTSWTRSQLAPLSRRLETLRPQFGTPLVWAMWRAAQSDLVAGKAKGLKTLLVLTDGNDTRLKDNPKYNPRQRSVPDYVLDAFKTSGIRIQMVFFTPKGDKKEIAAARENFAGALPQLDIPGSFVLANNLSELIATLRRGIRQRLTYDILKQPDWTAVNEEPLEVTEPGELDRWWIKGLDKGTYKLRIHADRRYEKEIDLNKGDRIVAKLIDGDDGGIDFLAALYSDRPEFVRKAQEDAKLWRLSVLSDQRRRVEDAEQLHLFTTLERKNPEHGGVERLRQLKPDRVWFRLEVNAVPDPATAFAVRWRERILYPAPAWQLDVPRWVNDPGGDGLARPVLRAWWREEDASPLPGLDLPFNAPGDPGVLPRSCEVGRGGTVILESIGIEDHHVEFEPGAAAEIHPCLVVRLSFPKDRPYIVDPRSLARLEIVGYRHQLYSRAGKYTGLFWSVTRDRLRDLEGLHLISLDELESEAEKAGSSARIQLPIPRVEDSLPRPPVAVLKDQ